MKLICVDIDGTLVKGQTQVMLVRYLLGGKYINLTDYLKVLVWYLSYKYFGSGVDKKLANKMYKKILGGLSKNEVDGILDSFMVMIEPKIDYLIVNYVKNLILKGDIVAIITTTIEPVAQRFSKIINATLISSTELEVKNNKYTGKTINGINDTAKKLYFLKRNTPGFNELLVITDHENDIDLLKLADKAIVVNPTKRLLNFAKKKNWEIITS